MKWKKKDWFLDMLLGTLSNSLLKSTLSGNIK